MIKFDFKSALEPVDFVFAHLVPSLRGQTRKKAVGSMRALEVPSILVNPLIL